MGGQSNNTAFVTILVARMQLCATLDLGEACKKFRLATCKKIASDIILAEIHDAAVEDALPIFTPGINAESTPYFLQPS